MREVALSLADNDSGFTFDLVFRTTSPPFLEAPCYVRPAQAPGPERDS